MSQIQTLYKNHFGMTGRPFSGLADATVFHWGPAHVRAQAALEYGLISGAPFSVLTGVAGSGKTSLLLNLLETAPDDMRVAMVLGLRRGGGSVLPWILQALGEEVPDGASETTLHSRIQNLMISEYAAGRRIVLIFDEAHNMSADALDELRVLSNINTARDQLIQIVLAGLPALRDALQDPDMAGLAQRVAAWGHIDTLDRDTLTGYVSTRLAYAGAPEDLFTADALDLVFEATAGLPRPINQLCELALVYAMTSDGPFIDAEVIRQVLDDGLFMRPVTALPSFAHLPQADGGDCDDV
ncbi:ExeA family protein [Jannaschia pohangensis]|uniref:Type II secretion system protein A n=1 Tax=Jannaschia pohangensis TaxID=390807 RepID=A0A1I3TTM0_9RHOB|nr:AAA family ATPase [Jannaschia pohangensis]SFJ73833.1 type II secretion system protein A [Jannaschia pohangensis]